MRVFEKLRDDFVAAIFSQPVMDGELLLERRERAVEIVGGVGYVKLGIFQVREQIREICFQRTIRGAHLLVRVVPFCFSRDERVLCFLLDEAAPRRMPCVECLRERRFVGFGERQSQCPELLGGLGLWSAREVLCYLLDLMELAHLHWNIAENVEETTPAVHDRREKRPAFLFEDTAPIAVVGHAFSFDFVPPDCFLEMRGAEHTDTIPTTPERRVGDRDGRLWHGVGRWHRNIIEMLAHPHVRAAVFLRELYKRLFSGNVLVPQIAMILGASLL